MFSRVVRVCQTGQPESRQKFLVRFGWALHVANKWPGTFIRCQMATRHTTLVVPRNTVRRLKSSSLRVLRRSSVEGRISKRDVHFPLRQRQQFFPSRIYVSHWFSRDTLLFSFCYPVSTCNVSCSVAFCLEAKASTAWRTSFCVAFKADHAIVHIRTSCRHHEN